MPHQIAAMSQRLAAYPQHSAWVSASAGSGKTKVLTDRVLNLLLEGCPPERILCLTFTKAAAAEMANRLRDRLGAWAILSEADLKISLKELQGKQPSPEKVERARLLFTLILDTPGGLKIQTIHSFCQSLLKRFPLEAELSPFFEVVNTTEQNKLIKKATEQVMDNPQLANELYKLILSFHESKFQEINTFIIQERTSFKELKLEEIDKVLQTQDVTEEKLLQTLIRNIPEIHLREDMSLLNEGSTTDLERAFSLDQFLNLDYGQRCQNYGTYLSFFLTQTGEMRARLLTQKLALKNPTFKETLEKEALRLENWVQQWKTLEIAQVSKAFLKYSLSFLEIYESLKKAESLLDYDDLILKTAALLKNPGCHWVLYKLDGGIDHILVDEAQDTNPAQWQVIRALAEEFYANASTDPRNRTLFIVGDDKQSIYSFQGANPAVFSQMQKDLKDFAQNSGQEWKDIDLNVSFRSTPEVLATVDATFSTCPLSSSSLQHLPFRKEAPGHVELWPLLKEEDKSPQDPWQPPVIQHHPDSPQKRLTQLIAKTIQGWLLGNHSFARPISPGDILILVRRRTDFVDHLIRTLKDHAIPVAGVDRLWLLEGIGIQDLLKIAEFLLLPTDDLTLATVLKGPLFNLSEEELFNLSHKREQTPLWERLKENKNLSSIHIALSDLLAQVDFLTPYALFSTLLGPLEGRKKWQAQLGPEVLDSLDEFLNLCLLYQDDHTPSLQGFLEWITEEIIELKRDLDQSNQVRVMTVHGSKGLQAPLVFLPDTTQPPHDTPSFDFYGKALLWLPPSTKDIPLTTSLKKKLREKQYAEYKRLLYVALTRAEDALYICGWETPYQDTWYNLVKEGLKKIGEEVEFEFFPPQEKGWRLSSLKETQSYPSPLQKKTSFLLPQWLKIPPPLEKMPEILRPSEADEDTHFESSDLGAFGTQRGTLIHKLLEILPPLEKSSRKQASLGFLKNEGISEDAALEMIEIAERILETYPDLFTPLSKGEVSLTGRLGGKILSGQLDRLIFNEDHILIVDYKTHTKVPQKLEDIPQTYIKQMAIYRAALKQIYPELDILCGLLWTEIPRLDLLPDSLMKNFTASIDGDLVKPYTKDNLV